MKFRLTESLDEPMLYINTWKNYNVNGADLDAYGIKDGWMTPEDALEFAEEHEEDEPFINDAMGVPFPVSEYDDIETVVENIKRYNDLDETEKEALKAYLETQNDNFDEAIGCIESGDYQFYPDFYSFTDLAYELVDELGGIKAAVGNPLGYIDEDMLRRDIELEFDDSDLRTEAEEYVRDKLYIDEDSDEFEEEVENYVSEHIEDAIDNLADECMRLAENGEMGDDFYETYFNYEQLGRDLGYDGYAQASNGIIYIC